MDCNGLRGRRHIICNFSCGPGCVLPGPAAAFLPRVVGGGGGRAVTETGAGPTVGQQWRDWPQTGSTAVARPSQPSQAPPVRPVNPSLGRGPPPSHSCTLVQCVQQCVQLSAPLPQGCTQCWPLQAYPSQSLPTAWPTLPAPARSPRPAPARQPRPGPAASTVSLSGRLLVTLGISLI